MFTFSAIAFTIPLRCEFTPKNASKQYIYIYIYIINSIDQWWQQQALSRRLNEMAVGSIELRGLLSINKVVLAFTLHPLPEEVTMLHTIHAFPSEHKEFSNELVSG